MDRGPGQLPAQPSGTTAASGSGTVPAGSGGDPVMPATPVSPLDAFNELWKNDPTKTADPNAPMFNVDPQKIMDAASKMDLSSAITAERLQAITAGGEGAAKAMAEMLQSANTLAVSQNIITSTKLVEQALKQARKDFAAEVPGLIKSQTLHNELQNENPALSHPAAQPIVSAIQQQMQVKFPTATSVELRSKVNEYFNGLAAIATKPNAPGTAKSQNRGETDWEAFLS